MMDPAAVFKRLVDRAVEYGAAEHPQHGLGVAGRAAANVYIALSEWIHVLAESKRHLAESIQGLAELKHCPPEWIHGLAESKHCPLDENHGLAESKHCPPDENHGLPEVVIGLPEVVNGLAEVVNDLAEVMKGLAEVMNGLAGRTNRAPATREYTPAVVLAIARALISGPLTLLDWLHSLTQPPHSSGCGRYTLKRIGGAGEMFAACPFRDSSDRTSSEKQSADRIDTIADRMKAIGGCVNRWGCGAPAAARRRGRRRCILRP